MSALFPEHTISKAEEEIRHHEEKCNPGHSRKGPRYHPYSQTSKQRPQENDQKSAPPAWKQHRKCGHKPSRGKASSYTQRPAKGVKNYK